MATLAKLLQVDMGLPEMAKRLAAAGRGKDTILAHINPKEARLLKSRGGSGKVNPDTGIMEFQTYDDDPEAYFSQQEAAAEPVQSYAPAAQDPAQQRQAQQPAAPAPVAVELPSQLPAPATPSPQMAAEFNKQTAAPSGGGFMEGVKNFGNQLGELNKALSPVTPYLKGGAALYGGIQAQQAQQQNQQQAAKNEAEVRALSEPYRQQAAQLQKQGQDLLSMGQAGGLTAAQQKQLEVQRAVASQQMASSGVTGGTSQQQLEANLQQQAASFAQSNIDQGNKLIQAAMGINATADKFITDAINVGYAENKDAQSLALDFYRSIAQFLEPEANTNPTQQANAARK